MLTWTDRAPEKPGWYWLLNAPQAKTTGPRPVQVYRDKLGRLSVCAHTLAWWSTFGGMKLMWAGPIDEPPEPEKIRRALPRNAGASQAKRH